MFGVREWDYVFDLSELNGPSRCSFKVLFDEHMRAQGFFWQAQECADWPSRAATAHEPPRDAPSPPALLPFATLSSDVLFALDASTLEFHAAAVLQPMIDELRQHAATTPEVQRLVIMVAGHTDRLGPQAHNAELSMRRAQAVANYLGARGLPLGAMDIIAHGEDLPVVECPEASMAEQIRCLAPNRRVEVLIQIVPPT